jgi:hypothetical protein
MLPLDTSRRIQYGGERRKHEGQASEVGDRENTNRGYPKI